MARRSRPRVDWRELPTRYRNWMALSSGQKLFWTLGKLLRILLLYGVFATVVVWYNLPEAFARILGGDQSVLTLFPLLAGDLELLGLLVIVLPMVALLVIVPHRRVDEHGREVH